MDLSLTLILQDVEKNKNKAKYTVSRLKKKKKNYHECALSLVEFYLAMVFSRSDQLSVTKINFSKKKNRVGVIGVKACYQTQQLHIG